MTFNYRVCSEVVSGVPIFSIREVYYDASGSITATTLLPMTLDQFDDPEELELELFHISRAFEKPVVYLNEFHWWNDTSPRRQQDSQ